MATLNLTNAVPGSILTSQRPDLWIRALSLATNLTGYIYAPKLPAADGTIWACGGGYYVPPPAPKPKTPDEIKKEKIEELENEIARKRQRIEERKGNIGRIQSEIDELEREISQHEDELKKLRNGGLITSAISLTVHVPEGAMEWLLHEVGHYVAATPSERLLPDYGYGTIKKKGWGKARELQAWGFEEIILSPFGNARLFAPPEHRGGTAFEKAGPIPDAAAHHALLQMQSLGIQSEQWRALYGEWIEWGKAQGAKAPWLHC